MSEQTINYVKTATQKIRRLKSLMSTSSAVRNDFKRAMRNIDDPQAYKHLLSAGFNIESDAERLAGLIIGFLLCKNPKRCIQSEFRLAKAIRIFAGENFNCRFQRIMKCHEVASFAQQIIRITRVLKPLQHSNIDLVSLYLDVRYFENNIAKTRIKWMQEYFSSLAVNDAALKEVV